MTIVWPDLSASNPLGKVDRVIVAVILLAVALLGTVVWAITSRSRATAALRAKQLELDAATARLDQAGAELTTASSELSAARTALQSTTEKLSRTDVELRHARTEVADAVKSRMRAEQRATEAETRLGELRRRRASADNGDTDAALLWALEQSRSQRTWSHGWAPGSPEPMPFEDRDRALLDALQAEVTAARETAGVIIQLDAELPDAALTENGCLLVLRGAQELLAGVTHLAELTTLRVRADLGDIVVTVHPVDEHGAALPVEPLHVPESPHVTAIANGVTVHDAILADPA